MKEKINIEKLFRESLNQLNVAAPQDAWTNIEKRLDKKKKRRILPPFWWKAGGIAAALVVGYFLGKNNVFEENNATDNTIVIENSNSNPNNKLNNSNKVGTELNQKTSIPYQNEQEIIGSSNESNNISVATNSEEKLNSVTNKRNNRIVNKTESNSDYKSSNTEILENNKVVVAGKTDKNKPNAKQNKNSLWEKFTPFEKMASQEKSSTIFDKTTKLSDDFMDDSDKNTIAKILKNTPNNQNNTSLTDQKSIIINKEITKKLDSTSVASAEPNALEELLNEKEKKSELNAEPKLNRWQVSTNVAPIYFSSLANGSPIDAKFESNQKSYNTSVSVGVGVQYALNKKFKIRTGINNLSLDYNTNDIRFTQTAEAKTLQNVEPNLAGKLLQVQTVAETPKQITLVDEGNELKVFSGSINQKLGYFEVPMEISYNLLNQKLGIEVLGGFSTMFLSQNEVNIVSSGLDMSIGEANNLNAMHFSGNLGLGIKYGIWKKLEARIEPVFKYQFNTFSNNDGNFRPYVFGVYSGFSYTF